LGVAMRSLPESAHIDVPHVLATRFLSAAKNLSFCDDDMLRDVKTQIHIREQIRSLCPDEFDWLVEEIRQRLCRSPFGAHITGMSFDESNLLFAAVTGAFGDLVEPNKQSWSQVVRRIQPATDRHEYGYGTLNEQLHTDGTDWPQPNDLTCLLCVRPDQNGGGQTRLLDIKDILLEVERDFGPDTLQTLYHESVPWRIADATGGGVVLAPILSENGIRYLRYTIELAQEHQSIALTHEVAQALDRLDHVISNSPSIFGLSLNRNDLLFVNNKSCLHARTKIHNSESSRRLILRVKVLRQE
jgi:Taurine catabolism dioxygenase TauD, TfdA family